MHKFVAVGLVFAGVRYTPQDPTPGTPITGQEVPFTYSNACIFRMALRGIKVVEMAGLAPVPFCGMILADFGASVIKVERSGIMGMDTLNTGKKSIIVNLKDREGAEVIRKLCTQSDVLIDPFRAGVMEKLGLGPKDILPLNPRLVYARLTGFGQTGPFAKMAGHDINYVALSGLLSLFGRPKSPPLPPVNLAADFGGGGLMCAFGILAALLERNISGKGQVIDASMVEGTAYLGSWLYRSQKLFVWGNDRGCNVLDGGAPFYDTYETSDEKYVAVGALEPQFYSCLLEKLGLDLDQHPQYSDWPKLRKTFTDIFRQRTQEEWSKVFDGSDACVTPVVSLAEAPHHKLNKFRNSFISQEPGAFPPIPKPAPVLSRTPGISCAEQPECQPGQHTAQVLAEVGYSAQEINKMAAAGTVTIVEAKSKL